MHQTKKKAIKTKLNERNFFFLFESLVVFLRWLAVLSHLAIRLFLKKRLFEPFKGLFAVFQELPVESDDNYTFLKKTNPPELSA